MSVHSQLPWIATELALIRDADRRGVPVAGHCLGSQLVALALGGTVRPHIQPEIGWGELYPVPGRAAQEWLGAHAMGKIETFQWHYDTFEPPQGAELLAVSRACRNQIVVVKDRHLLVQSHFEVTPDIIERMAASVGRSDIPGVSSLHAQDEVALRTQRMHRVLGRLYARWAQPFQ